MFLTIDEIPCKVETEFTKVEGGTGFWSCKVEVKGPYDLRKKIKEDPNKEESFKEKLARKLGIYDPNFPRISTIYPKRGRLQFEILRYRKRPNPLIQKQIAEATVYALLWMRQNV